MKKVAIFAESEAVKLACKQVLSLLIEQELVYFQHCAELTQAILENKIHSIIHVTTKNIDIKAIIRHDLKNLPGWNIEKANKFTLPPINKPVSPIQLTEVLKLIHSTIEIENGKTMQQTDTPKEKYVLRDHIDELKKSEMVGPWSKTRVVIVDDRPEEIEGMLQVLFAWPDIDISTVIPQKRDTVVSVAEEIIDCKGDIILLDEFMGQHIKGTDVARELQARSGYFKTLASITGGEPPHYTPYHFGRKTAVGKYKEPTVDFIHFIGDLF